MDSIRIRLHGSRVHFYVLFIGLCPMFSQACADTPVKNISIQPVAERIEEPSYDDNYGERGEGCTEYKWKCRVEPFLKTCIDKKLGGACLVLSDMHRDGECVPKDVKRSQDLVRMGRDLLHDLCEKGSYDACRFLRRMYRHGKHLKKDKSLSMEYARKAQKARHAACMGGDIESCGVLNPNKVPKHGLYKIMFDPGVLESFKDQQRRGLELMEKACEEGDAKMCLELGKMMEDEKFAEKYYFRSLMLYTMACDKGDAKSCRETAWLYCGYPWGPPKDESIEKEYLLRAAEIRRINCDKGDSNACFDLAHMWMNGIGVPKDPAFAEKIYIKSCDLGHYWACNNLGYMYWCGVELPKAIDKARTMLKTACDGGVYHSCCFLMEMESGMECQP